MKKKNNWFTKIIILLFIVFLGVYISSVNGYYDTKVGKKVALTDQALKDFEKDVLNGENVDIKDYLEQDNIDYSNKFTDTGEKVADSLVVVITDGLSGIWDAIKVLFF